MIAFQHSAILNLYPRERTLPTADDFASFHSELTGKGRYLTHLTRITGLPGSHRGSFLAHLDILWQLSASTGKYVPQQHFKTSLLLRPT
jgi:hypothetical protein